MGTTAKENEKAVNTITVAALHNVEAGRYTDIGYSLLASLVSDGYVKAEGAKWVLDNKGHAYIGPKYCPMCGSRDSLQLFMVVWNTSSTEDPGNTSKLDEHQCYSPQCNGRSFWS